MGIRGSFYLMVFISLMQTANVALSFYAGVHPALQLFGVAALVYVLYVTRKTWRVYGEYRALEKRIQAFNDGTQS